MNPIWIIHHLVKNKLPKSLIKKLRGLVESNFDFLWEKKFYSQFGEDAILSSMMISRNWNAYKNSKNVSGFYVDVGACAPKQFSNTYFFYKQGWCGINIDATPGSMNIFKKVRKRDINIEAAVSDESKDLTFYSWGVHELTNTFSIENAELFTKQFGKEPEQIVLRTQRLEQILDKYLPKNQPIDFFSVDAENHNLEVLRSNNWEKYRPKYLVVEADDQNPTLEQILSSEILSFMKTQHYHLAAWVDINLFFEQDT
jgi:hypothetical protein